MLVRCARIYASDGMGAHEFGNIFGRPCEQSVLAQDEVDEFTDLLGKVCALSIYLSLSQRTS